MMIRDFDANAWRLRCPTCDRPKLYRYKQYPPLKIKCRYCRQFQDVEIVAFILTGGDDGK